MRGVIPFPRKVAIALAAVALQACVAPNATLNFATPSDLNGIQGSSSTMSWSGNTQILTGGCNAYTLTIVSTSTPTWISFSDPGTGSFYQDSLCALPITSITIPAQGTSQSVYFSTAVSGAALFVANSADLNPANYFVTVNSGNVVPSISGMLPQIFPADQFIVGIPKQLSFVNNNTGNNTGMTYTCFYNRDFSTTFVSTCASLPGFTVNTTQGILNWTPDLATAWGAYYFKVVGTNAGGSSSVTFYADVAADYTTSNLVFDLDADFATLYAPASNSPFFSTWENLGAGGAIYSGGLSGFPAVATTNDGWSGVGTTASPRALTFGAVSGELVTISNLSPLPEMITAWVAPSSIVGTKTGGVIFTSNGNGLYGPGVTLRQSEDFASKYELEVGTTYTYSQDISATPGLIGYWKLNDQGNVLNDYSGMAQNGNYYLQTALSVPTYSALGPLNADLSNGAVTLPYGGDVLYGNAAVTPTTTETSGYSEEIWFKTPIVGYSLGGLLMGLGNTTIGGSSQVDRQLIMGNSGHLTTEFSDTSATVHTMSTVRAYNDGLWHHAVVTVDPVALVLSIFVDGVLDDQSSYTGTAQTLPIFHWRFGYDNTALGAASPEFQGELAEASVYSSALSAAQVFDHHQMGYRRCQSGLVANNNAWTFLAMTFDGENGELYVNGSLACSVAFQTTGSINGNSFVIIGNTPGGDHQWNGSIADFKGYSSGGAAEILNIFNATSPRF